MLLIKFKMLNFSLVNEIFEIHIILFHILSVKIRTVFYYKSFYALIYTYVNIYHRMT